MEKKELTCIKVLEGEIFEIELPLGKGDMWCIPCDLPECLEIISNKKEKIEYICDDPCNANVKDRCMDPCCEACFIPCCAEQKPLQLKQVFKFRAVKPCCVCLEIKLIKINCKICDVKLFKIMVSPVCVC